MTSYTGIGSRSTPHHIQLLMTKCAEDLGKKGIILRSGGASGADRAFDKGAVAASGPREIYIPWDFFNGYASNQVGVYCRFDPEAERIAQDFHPNWAACSQGARRLHTRNVYQVLGKNLNDPSEMVLCYTPVGSGSGGTGQAIRIAKGFNIPVYDLGDPKVHAEVLMRLNQR